MLTMQDLRRPLDKGTPTKASSASSGTDDAIVSSLFCRVLDQPEEQIDLARRLFKL